MNPRLEISVVMPVFNGARWLPESIASIQRQSQADLEFIVVDDGSTDDTAAVVRRCAPAARYFRQENQGQAAARNAGLRQARGALIAFLDHDDAWPEGSLAARVQALKDTPTALYVMGRTRFLELTPPEPWVSPNLGAGLFRRAVFERVGMFNEACRLAEDVEWFFRLRELALPAITLEFETLLYRRGTGGVTHARTWRDPEMLRTVRDSLARRRAAAGVAAELPLLSGSARDPRAAGFSAPHEPEQPAD